MNKAELGNEQWEQQIHKQWCLLLMCEDERITQCKFSFRLCKEGEH